MTSALLTRHPRLRRSVLMIATVAGAIVALPFMLMLLIARIGDNR